MQGSKAVPLGTVRVQRRFGGSRLEMDLWAAVFEELLLGSLPQAVSVAVDGCRAEDGSDMPMSQPSVRGGEQSKSRAFAV